MRRIPIMAALVAMSLMAPAATFAQEVKDASSIPEPGNPEARRQMLNASEAEAAQAQVAANEAAQAHHDTAVALTEMKAERDAQRYTDTLVRHDRAEEAYRADRKEWERTNPYCWKGDAVKCPADPEAPATGG